MCIDAILLFYLVSTQKTRLSHFWTPLFGLNVAPDYKWSLEETIRPLGKQNRTPPLPIWVPKEQINCDVGDGREPKQPCHYLLTVPRFMVDTRKSARLTWYRGSYSVCTTFGLASISNVRDTRHR